MSDDNVPYIVTMNFVFSTNGAASLYFHSACEGKKINILKKNNLVCFQADIEHEFFTWRRLWLQHEVSECCGYGKDMIRY